MSDNSGLLVCSSSREQYLLFDLGHFIRSTVAVNLKFISMEPVFLYTCTSCSKLLSNISTMSRLLGQVYSFSHELQVSDLNWFNEGLTVSFRWNVWMSRGTSFIFMSRYVLDHVKNAFVTLKVRYLRPTALFWPSYYYTKNSIVFKMSYFSYPNKVQYKELF